MTVATIRLPDDSLVALKGLVDEHGISRVCETLKVSNNTVRRLLEIDGYRVKPAQANLVLGGLRELMNGGVLASSRVRGIDPRLVPRGTAAARPNHKVRTEFLTPERAAELAKKIHPAQRNLRPSTVDYYARLIVRGELKTTNNGIGIDARGRVVDGQHRIHAVVEAGIGIWTHVVYGMTLEEAIAADQGIPKGPHDQIHMSGSLENIFGKDVKIRDTTASSVCTHMWRFIGGLSGKMSHSEREQLMRYYGDSFKFGLSFSPRTVRVASLRRSHIMGCAVVAHARAPKEDAQFFESVSSGELLTHGDPAYALREYFLRQDGKIQQARDTPGNQCRRTLNAAMHHVQGNRLQHVSNGSTNNGLTYFIESRQAWRMEVFNYVSR